MTTNVALNILNQPRGTDFELVRTLLGGAGGLKLIRRCPEGVQRSDQSRVAIDPQQSPGLVFRT
jgi:hypothetical protein